MEQEEKKRELKEKRRAEQEKAVQARKKAEEERNLAIEARKQAAEAAKEAQLKALAKAKQDAEEKRRITEEGESKGRLLFVLRSRWI